MVEIETLDYFYRLKPRKRSWTSDNIELDIGKEYFVLSYVQEKFIRREVDETLPLRDMETLLKMKLLWKKSEQK